VSLYVPATALSIRPVVILHGILDSYATMQPLVDHITNAFPNASVVSLNVFNWFYSVEDMWYQVDGVIQAMKDLPAEFDDGYTCIGFSQGTLVLRAVVESWTDHKCHTLITLSGPLMGQFGDTSYLRYFFPNYTRDSLYEVFYFSEVQDHFSVADYWKDPFHLQLYLQVNTFLSYLNNDNMTGFKQEYKTNFLKLKQLVLVGGPDDGVITPWQSSQFGFFDGDLNVVPMENQTIYRKDTFGLKTLHDDNRLFTCIQSGVEHTTWYSNAHVFDKCIKPFLAG